MEIPAREFLMPSYAYSAMYLVFFVCGAIMLYGLYAHLRSYGIGLTDFLRLASKDLSTKVVRFLRFGVGQRKVMTGDSGGAMHGAVFFGFLALLFYTTLIFIQSDILGPLFGVAYLNGGFYLILELLGDTLGIAFLIGLGIAIYRRFVKRLEKLETKWDDYLVISMLVWIGISGFFVESIRLLWVPTQWAIFSPVGDALSMVFAGAAGVVPQAPFVYQIFWWGHMLSVMALIAITPYTKLIHVITSGLNVALAPVKPMGRLNTPFNLAEMLKSGKTDTPPNAHRSSDFAPLQLLALDSCTNCGRCQEVCPAFASGRDLSPRVVIQDLGRDLADAHEDVFDGGVIRDSELWACTMCNACVSVCPVFINQVDYIVEYRRTLVNGGKLDGKKRIFLENEARNNNPFGAPQSERQSWLLKLGVPTIQQNPSAEYLYWIGCQSSYDPRGRGVALAVIKILQAASVNFAVLGNAELCTGEPVRRMGEEGKFQELALKNIETLRNAGVRRIIVHCAHCFNTFRNEYPEFGGQFEVIHHTELISQLLAEGRLELGELKKRVTFHDPCNLGRMNGVFDAPRESLLAAPGLELIEMKRSRMNSFCCGGGGANAWYEVPEKKKISVLRVEEARSTGAEMLAVACPFCITMFEDASKGMGVENFEVRDVAEILAAALPPS